MTKGYRTLAFRSIGSFLVEHAIKLIVLPTGERHTPSYTYKLTGPATYSHTYTPSNAHPLIHPPTHTPTHSLTHPHTHTLTHPLSHAHTHTHLHTHMLTNEEDSPTVASFWHGHDGWCYVCVCVCVCVRVHTTFIYHRGNFGPSIWKVPGGRFGSRGEGSIEGRMGSIHGGGGRGARTCTSMKWRRRRVGGGGGGDQL